MQRGDDNHLALLLKMVQKEAVLVGLSGIKPHCRSDMFRFGLLSFSLFLILLLLQNYN